jgi:hypothetical protein
VDPGLGDSPGEILTLVDLIDEHPSEFAYDWRSRFGMPISSVFTGDMTWNEAWLLFERLANDPTSWVGAALSGMDYPFSHEAMIAADSFDAFVKANSSRRHQRSLKPYPRPFPVASRDVQRSQKPTADTESVAAALAARGH